MDMFFLFQINNITYYYIILITLHIIILACLKIFYKILSSRYYRWRLDSSKNLMVSKKLFCACHLKAISIFIILIRHFTGSHVSKILLHDRRSCIIRTIAATTIGDQDIQRHIHCDVSYMINSVEMCACIVLLMQDFKWKA